MKDKSESGIIRDSVNGEAKYCRIPIRQRRTPIYSYELEEILHQYTKNGCVDVEAIQEDAVELFANNQCEDAGLLCSVLDFIKLFGRISFVEWHGGTP